MAITGSEGFERIEKADLVYAKPFTSKAGQVYTLTTPASAGTTASGFKAPIKDGAGNVELVVGDQSTVKIEFGRSVRDFSVNYYVKTDYTAEDLAAEYPDQVGAIDLSSLDENSFDNFYTIRFIGNDQDTVYTGPVSTRIASIPFNEYPFHTVEISTSRAGSVHIDNMRWTQVG